MKSVKGKFEDGHIEKLKFINQFLVDSFYERGQLYGTLAKLMLDTHTDSFTMTVEELQEISAKNSIQFTPIYKDEKLVSLEVEVVEHSSEEKESDG